MIFRRLTVALVAISIFVLPLTAQQAGSAEGPALRGTAPTPDVVTAPNVSTTLVLSQVSGGNGFYADDWVEIKNISGTSQSLNGLSLYYGSATTGNFGQGVFALPNASVGPGNYFLVRLPQQGVSGAALPVTPDATANSNQISMSGSSGKIALVVASQLQANVCGGASTPCNASQLAAFVDWVAYGAAGNGGAGLGEGGTSVNNGTALSSTQEAVRKNGGCTDNDNNNADFDVVANSVPRNSATAAAPCAAVSTNPTGAGAASPSNPAPNSTVTLTVTVTPGTNPTSTGTAVVADLTSIGGLQAQSFFDNGTNGDAVAGDNIFTFQSSAGGASGVKTIPFTVSDSLDRGSGGSFQFTVQGPSAPSGTGTANPSSVLPGGTTTLTVTVIPGTQPTSQTIAVSGDLSSIGGSATQAFADSGDGVHFTYNATVANNTAIGNKTLQITITDDQARAGSFNLPLAVISQNDPQPKTPAEHEVMGNPSPATHDPNNPHDYLVERNQYVLSYDRDRGIPNWVEWHLDTATWIGSSGRTGNFTADTSLPAGWYQVQPGDYSGSGFDKGHNCPSGDRTITDADNAATFLMDNMIPQAPDNNQGPWATMENDLRGLASSNNELYIWMGNGGVGGTGSNGGVTTSLANNHVVVPAYVWKVVMVLPKDVNDLARVNASTRVFAVILPNTQGIRTDDWHKYIATVKQVEQLTGYTFFPNVAPGIRSALETKLDPTYFTSSTAQVVTGGTVSTLNLTYPNTYLTGNVTVTSNLALGPETLHTNKFDNTAAFKITLAPGATVTRLSGEVDGTLEKQFNAAPASFVYPVGTTNGYSPVTVDLTAVGQTPAGLSVKAVQGPQPNAPTPSTALQRYWTLSNTTGTLSANLSFNYLPTDVPSGTQESNLALNKYEGFWTQPSATVNTTTHVASTTSPVSSFSDWTLLPLITTAADVGVSGRVLSSNGAGLRNARVTLNDGAGHTYTAISNSFGYYSFEGIPSGQSYLISGSARGYIFTPRILTVSDQLTDVDLTALQ